MSLAHHVWDGSGWQRDLSLQEATAAAQAAIDQARAACDPEWPAHVDEICIVQAPRGTDDEGLGDCDAVMMVIQVEVRPAPPESGLDEICDYALRPCTPSMET